MKTFEFKLKSWHFWLANFGETRVYGTTDICSYIRNVLKGLLLFIIFLLTIGGLGGLLCFVVGNIIGWLFMDYQLHDASLFVGGLTLGFIVLIGSLVAKEEIQSKEPGVVRLAYRSWKDKFCARIEFK